MSSATKTERGGYVSEQAVMAGGYSRKAVKQFRRKGPSTAARLSRSATGRLFGTLLFMNIVLTAALCWVSLWRVERDAVRTLGFFREQPAESAGTAFPDDSTVYVREARTPAGFTFVSVFRRVMPGDNAIRGFYVTAGRFSGFPYLTRTVSYAMYFPGQGDMIIVPVADELMLLSIVMTALLFLQFIQLMWFSMRNRGVIERRIRPFNQFFTEAVSAAKDPLHARLKTNWDSTETTVLAQVLNEVLDSAAEVHKSYGERSRFVSDASHELRTPIAVIQGYANMLDRWGKDDPDTLNEAIQALKNEADGMQKLVEQLLFLSRGDNGGISLNRVALDASALMREAYQEAVMIDGAHRYEMLENGPVTVMADAGLLKQALRALLDNSRKYTPENGLITLSCKCGGGEARLSVEDTGAGIERQDVPRVFDRFFRADQSRTRKTGGSGLGLSIAKWIVERHDGSIEVLSRVGAGTRVTFVLPNRAE